MFIIPFTLILKAYNECIPLIIRSLYYIAEIGRIFIQTSSKQNIIVIVTMLYTSCLENNWCFAV